MGHKAKTEFYTSFSYVLLSLNNFEKGINLFINLPFVITALNPVSARQISETKRTYREFPVEVMFSGNTLPQNFPTNVALESEPSLTSTQSWLNKDVRLTTYTEVYKLTQINIKDVLINPVHPNNKLVYQSPLGSGILILPQSLDFCSKLK